MEEYILDFENTQFISIETSLKSEEITQVVHEEFSQSGFEVINADSIQPSTMKYLEKHNLGYFYELTNDDFVPEIDEWFNISKPPPPVTSFVSHINHLICIDAITRVKVILTGYIYVNEPDDTVILISPQELTHSLYLMSRYSYTLLNGKENQMDPENLILDIDCSYRDKPKSVRMP